MSKYPESEVIKSNSTGVAEPIQPTKEALEYFKSAHFYWLGSDMETAIRTVINMPEKDLTIRAIKQALWHFRNTGLNDTDIEERLRWLIKLNEDTLLSKWVTDTSRRDILNEILIVKTKIDHLVQREAGNKFRPFEN